MRNISYVTFENNLWEHERLFFRGKFFQIVVNSIRVQFHRGRTTYGLKWKSKCRKKFSSLLVFTNIFEKHYFNFQLILMDNVTATLVEVHFFFNVLFFKLLCLYYIFTILYIYALLLFVLIFPKKLVKLQCFLANMRISLSIQTKEILFSIVFYYT